MGNLFLTANASTSSGAEVAKVCAIGIGVVFAGLVLIIGLVEIMTRICNKLSAKAGATAKAQQAPLAQAPQANAVSTAIENRGEIIAAVCAAVAEENDTDISAIRVISFKKV